MQNDIVNEGRANNSTPPQSIHTIPELIKWGFANNISCYALANGDGVATYDMTVEGIHYHGEARIDYTFLSNGELTDYKLSVYDFTVTTATGEDLEYDYDFSNFNDYFESVFQADQDDCYKERLTGRGDGITHPFFY